MIPEKEVRNSNNMVIGKCMDFGDQINAIHYARGYVGRYVKGNDITFDKDGRVFSYGDSTAALLLKEEAEYNNR